MWQRFTDRARRVVQYAQEEAMKCGLNYIGTEHLLLGLVREGESVAARILEKFGVLLGRLRAEVEKRIERPPSPRPVSPEEMALAPDARRCLTAAMEEARRMGHNYVGTEHLLLGLLREQEGLAAQILATLGIGEQDIERVREQIRRYLGELPTPAELRDRASQLAELARELAEEQQERGPFA